LVVGGRAVPAATPSGESPAADEKSGSQLDRSFGVDTREGQLSAPSLS